MKKRGKKGREEVRGLKDDLNYPSLFWSNQVIMSLAFMDYSALIQRIRPSVGLVIVTKPDPTTGKDVTTFGSGFVYREIGKFATCNHVVQDATKIQVRFTNSTNLIDAVLHRQDIIHDLAVLNITYPIGMNPPTPLTMPANLDVKEGQPVLFCGFPIFASLFMTHHGMISAIETDPLGNVAYGVDGSNNKGNSGGPLFNENGDVIGVMSLKAHNDGDKLLENISKLKPGAISIFGSDLVSIHQHFIDNIRELRRKGCVARQKRQF